MPGPNLLYLHSDQHSAAVLGCYGDPLVETPNLDALAAQGVVLDSCYCPSPICVPSRASMLSGRFPYENRVWTNDHQLDPSIPTFAHAMGAAGYRPALIGRMHALGPDQLHGYAERLVGDHGPNRPGGRGVDHGQLQGTAGPARVSLELSGPGQSAYQVHDEDVAASAVHWLDQLGVRKRAGVMDKPFSLSVGFMLPHQPFVARAADYRKYEGKVGLPRLRQPYDDTLHPHFRRWRQQCGIVEVSEAEILRARTAYWALCDRLDKLLGQILNALRDNDLDQDTLIVYMSDHGEQVGERDLWWKQTMYEESARVPAILSWPGKLPEGERCPRVASSLDLNATMIDALGGPPLPLSRGRSLLPLLTGQSTDWEDVAFSEYCTNDGCFHRMVREGDWKLTYYHGQPVQLFNLAEDPDEMHDRAGDPKCEEVRERLRTKVLDGWDPEWVKREIEDRQRELPILRDWARTVQPADTCRWSLLPKMDYLDP